MRATPVIPVKRFAEAKQRLQPDVEPLEREQIAEEMLRLVLEAVRPTRRLDTPIIVTGEPDAKRLARLYKYEVVDDVADAGHSEAALLGIHHAMNTGANAVVLLPGDCPVLSIREVDDLLDRLSSPSVTVIPDRHGTGTNGLVLSPPDAIEPAFGEGSHARHLELARQAGVPAATANLRSLALDIDTPEDLELWRASS
jgi:2-phospho-L-lactate guanylyltransferase